MAVATIDRRPGTAAVSAVQTPADDPVILDLMEGADKVGIDCPLGWPDALVQFVTTHHNDALALRRTQLPVVTIAACRLGLM